MFEMNRYAEKNKLSKLEIILKGLLARLALASRNLDLK